MWATRKKYGGLPVCLQNLLTRFFLCPHLWGQLRQKTFFYVSEIHLDGQTVRLLESLNAP